MYFLKVLAGTAGGQFEGQGSPMAVGIPTKGVRTAASMPLIEAYDETFCRISWTKPGNGVESTGPAASHFAVAYRCGATPSPIVYPQVYTSTTATLHVPFTMDQSCQVLLCTSLLFLSSVFSSIVPTATSELT